MDKVMKIAVDCDWKQQGEAATFQMSDGSTVQLIANAPGEGFDGVVDIQKPFKDISAKYPRERRIYATTEPSGLSGDPDVKAISDYYGTTLSWHEKLRQLPQNVVWHPCGKWVTPCPPEDPKEFGMGGFISFKCEPMLDGYALRMAILRMQDEIKIPGTVFNFQGKWKGAEHAYPVERKDPGMKWMFHLSIENQREPGWFTEKLIDAIAARTVPLYFGAPDISSFFDIRGMIILEAGNFLDQINALRPDDYEIRKGFLDRNYEASKQFWNFDHQLAQKCWSAIKVLQPPT